MNWKFWPNKLTTILTAPLFPNKLQVPALSTVFLYVEKQFAIYYLTRMAVCKALIVYEPKSLYPGDD